MATSTPFSVTLKGPSGVHMAFLEVVEHDDALRVQWHVTGQPVQQVTAVQIESPRQAQEVGLELTRKLIEALWT